MRSVSVPSRGILFPNKSRFFWKYRLRVSVPSRGILFPNKFRHVSEHTWRESFRPLSGHLISKFVLCSWYNTRKELNCFRPLSGHLISKYCPPEPAILLAFLTLLRGKSFSCIFFLYLTYTIASKCSIYAVRGKIINYTNTIWTAILLFRINLFFFYFLKYSHS